MRLTLRQEGEDTIEVDEDEYRAAKAAGELDKFLDVYVSDMEHETLVMEPDGTAVYLTTE